MSDENFRAYLRGSEWDHSGATSKFKVHKVDVNGFTWSSIFENEPSLVDFYIGPMLFEDFTKKQIKKIRKTLKKLLKELKDVG